MKLPLSWLNEYVDVKDVPVKLLEEKLFYCGFEVEEVIHVGNVDKIVFCRIESLSKHPNADKLTICQVDAGKYGKLQIVTAATNVFEGALVPVAVDGATLADGGRIYNGKLRGEPSFGMFCSGEELGINDSYYDGASVNGILIFKEDYPLGEEVKDLLELEDYIFDISVTANRPDCQSIVGLAREVAAVLNKPFKMPDLSVDSCSGLNTEDYLKVSVDAQDLCPRYIAHYVKNVKIEPSPYWLRRRLYRMGINSINNIVDITNYVLLELGQPMHAFDYRYIEGDEICVRRARSCEKITTLDEKEFELSDSNLVICDAIKPIALAGIMGGLNSEIKNDTTEIVFEAAKFKRDSVRRTSRALGQRSDSSARFEKGVDAYTTGIAMMRALNLINRLNAGDVAISAIDCNTEAMVPAKITTTATKINSLLGIKVPVDEMVAILKSLDFAVENNGDNLIVDVPLYREDVVDYPDLAEEIIREYGYDHINCTLFEGATITDGGKTSTQSNEDLVKGFLTDVGFYEAITYSFVSDKFFTQFDLNPAQAVKLSNPLGEDFSLMRTSIVPSLVNVVVKNLNKNNNAGRIFEYASVYLPKSVPLTELPDEKRVLALATYGDGEDFYTVKGVIAQLMALLKCDGEMICKAANISYMHPGRSAELFIGQKYVGYFGELNPMTAEKLGLEKRVYVAELDFGAIESTISSSFEFKQISKYPSVERDLALLVDKKITNDEVIKCIYNSRAKNIESVVLFDVYNGQNLPDGKQSLAYRIKFTCLDRTLSVEDVDKYISKILKALKENLDIDIR